MSRSTLFCVALFGAVVCVAFAGDDIPSELEISPVEKSAGWNRGDAGDEINISPVKETRLLGAVGDLLGDILSNSHVYEFGRRVNGE